MKNLKERIELFMNQKGIEMDLVKYAIKTSIKKLPIPTIAAYAGYTLVVYFACPKNIVKKCLKLGALSFIGIDILIMLAAIGFVLTKGEIKDKVK